MAEQNLGKWRDQIVRQEEVDPADLMVNPNNWRIHPKYQQEALEAVLSDVGWVRPVIVNEISGHIVDGHARVQQALHTGQATVPVAFVSLSQDEENLALATLDPIAELSFRDDGKLRALVEATPTNDARIEALYDSFLTGDVEDFASETPTLQKGQHPLFRCYVGGLTFQFNRDGLAAWQIGLELAVGTDEKEDILAEILSRLGIDEYMGE